MQGVSLELLVTENSEATALLLRCLFASFLNYSENTSENYPQS